MTVFAGNDAWEAAWDPVIAHIGSPFSTHGLDGRVLPDPVEASTIRRYIEPLEFDCALHWDREVARAHGHPDVIAPYTAIVAYAFPPMWRPGTTLFTTDERNAQPASTPVKPRLPDWFPPTTGYFATDMDIEFLRPATIGDVVRMQAGVLRSCCPKETSVGRGAFITSDTLLLDQHAGPIARMISGAYLYQPHPEYRP